MYTVCECEEVPALRAGREELFSRETQSAGVTEELPCRKIASPGTGVARPNYMAAKALEPYSKPGEIKARLPLLANLGSGPGCQKESESRGDERERALPVAQGAGRAQLWL